MKVSIDCGHAKNTPGKRWKHSNFTFFEYEFNRKVGLKLKELLAKQGIVADFTCNLDDEKDMGLSERASKSRGYDLLISIHANASENTSANGYEVFVGTNASKNSHRLADLWIENMKSTGLRNRGKKVANFTVIQKSPVPAILIECGFFTNEKEAIWMNENVQLLAEILATTIINYKK